MPWRKQVSAPASYALHARALEAKQELACQLIAKTGDLEPPSCARFWQTLQLSVIKYSSPAREYALPKGNRRESPLL